MFHVRGTWTSVRQTLKLTLDFATLIQYGVDMGSMGLPVR